MCHMEQYLVARSSREDDRKSGFMTQRLEVRFGDGRRGVIVSRSY